VTCGRQQRVVAVCVRQANSEASVRPERLHGVTSRHGSSLRPPRAAEPARTGNGQHVGSDDSVAYPLGRVMFTADHHERVIGSSDDLEWGACFGLSGQAELVVAGCEVGHDVSGW